MTTPTAPLTAESLRKICSAHASWLREEPEGVRATLRRADLENASLPGTTLRSAILHGAQLSGADLQSADLRSADLRDARLSDALLNGADLRDANLIGAHLLGTDLQGAILKGAQLQSACLANANLHGANLTGAHLSAETVLPTGEQWSVYLGEVVPQLLLAGGRGLEAIQAWGKHSWEDCPMHIAFAIDDVERAPALLRPRIAQFIQLYDAGLIPSPFTPTPSESAAAEEQV